jgi:uncharacterized protein (DUF1697 family)
MGCEPYIALLRGVNVGGKHILPMKELVALVSAYGCRDVRTYIQSGNIVFAASPDVARKLPDVLDRKIQERFGFASPVILRTTDELAQVCRNNPFLKHGAPEKELHVHFLTEVPTKDAIQSLDPNRSLPDAFRVIGREVYLHVPNGMGRTKLTSTYLDSRLATVGTARNWATVNKLLEIAASQCLRGASSPRKSRNCP